MESKNRSRNPDGAACAALVALALSCALPATALAQRGEGGKKQRVYILAVPGSEAVVAETARVAAAARAALRQQDVNWQDPDQLYLGYGDDALEKLAKARDQLERGRTAYLNLELDLAIELLSKAVDNFDAAAIAMEDPKGLSDALLFLGASQVFQGQMRDARTTFRRLHVQMPQAEPDPDTFPPDVVKNYERAAPRDAGRPSSTISITSDPPGAVAYIDFVPRGRTPVEASELLAGEHNVRVVRPGATPFVQTVEVQLRGSQQVNAFIADQPETQGLADAVQRIAASDIDQAKAPDAVTEVAGILDLDAIGVIRVSQGGSTEQVTLDLAMYDVATGNRVVQGGGPAPTALGGPMQEAVDELVAGGIERAARAAATSSGQATDSEVIPAATGDADGADDDDDGEPGPAQPLWKQWWLWSAVGAVVVLGIGLGVGLGKDDGQTLGSETGGQVFFEL